MDLPETHLHLSAFSDEEVERDFILSGTFEYTLYIETNTYEWAAMSVLLTLSSVFMVIFLIASFAGLMGWAGHNLATNFSIIDSRAKGP